MKKLISILVLIMLLTACDSQDNSSSVSSNFSSVSSGFPSTADSDTSASETSDAVIGGEPIVKHENPRVDYTDEEVREIIEKHSNLKVNSDFFYTSVPKTIDHLSEFYTGTSYQLPPEKELEEFKIIFKYLFPDHELDENCIYASAALDNVDPEEQDMFKTKFHSLKNEDNYNAYMNGTLGNPKYMRHLVYTEMQFQRENSVSLWYRSPFGNDYCMFNKGVCNKLYANKRGEEKYYAYEQFRLSIPDFGFELVGKYPPDSEQTFKLLDKETSIQRRSCVF